AVHVETLGEELCVYDGERRRVHALNATAARVWRRCDGDTSAAEMAARLAGELGVPVGEAEGLVALALGELGRAGLLERSAGADPETRGVTRRKLLAGGAALAVLPVVHTIVAPTAAAAQSPMERFVDQGATILDTQTGLIWEK